MSNLVDRVQNRLEHEGRRVRGAAHRGANQVFPAVLTGFRSQVEEVHAQIARHHLLGSFKAHCKQQFDTTEQIRVGIVDEFGSGSHGEGATDRLLAAAPLYLRGKIVIDVFDADQWGNGGAIQRGAEAAMMKSVVALLVSGAVQFNHITTMANRIGASQITHGNRSQAFEALLGTYQDRSYVSALRLLNEASRVVPVVTPIGNDGLTHAAALGDNTIVTSILGDNSFATRSDLVDIRMIPLFGNLHTSQSGPICLGQALDYRH